MSLPSATRCPTAESNRDIDREDPTVTRLRTALLLAALLAAAPGARAQQAPPAPPAAPGPPALRR